MKRGSKRVWYEIEYQEVWIYGYDMKIRLFFWGFSLRKFINGGVGNLKYLISILGKTSVSMFNDVVNLIRRRDVLLIVKEWFIENIGNIDKEWKNNTVVKWNVKEIK